MAAQSPEVRGLAMEVPFNLPAMLLGDFPLAWTGLSLCAVDAALVATALQFRDAWPRRLTETNRHG